MKAAYPWLSALAVAALAMIVLAAPSRAENPRVSLKVENATAREAAAQLSRAAGIQVDVYPPAIPAEANPPVPAPLEQKASFDWTGTTFARALRQLCEKYGLRPNPRPAGGYTLYPAAGAAVPAPAQKPVGLFEKNGVRLFARGINVTDYRAISFANGVPLFGPGASLSLHLACELADGDAERIAGVQNLTARDDLGNLILSDDQGRSYYSSGYGQYPDEWSGSVTFTPPHPKAKKLQWVEGDLMAYSTVTPLRVELPLPFAGKSARKEAGGLIFLLSRYQDTPDPQADGDEQDDFPVQRLGPLAAAPAGFSVRVRVYEPRDAHAVARNGSWGYMPYAVGASGQAYSVGVSRGGQGGRADQQGTVIDHGALGFIMPEKPVKLVWDLVEKSQPQKLLSFRMTDIPLPQQSAFAAARRANPPPVLAASPDRPYYAKGGGVLVSRVQLQERPAGEGSLAMGLSARNGAEWSAIRWISVDVARDGTARLEDLKPGSYRLLRAYQPRQPGGGPPAPGRWLNGELTVEVAAGKEIVLPSLRWEPVPDEETPAPARAAPRPPRPGR
jgi:hypothetical protein